MREEYQRVLREFGGVPGGRIGVNAKTGSSAPTSPHREGERQRSMAWAMCSAILHCAEEEILSLVSEGKIKPDFDPMTEVKALVTKNITKGQAMKEPFSSYDWLGAFEEECRKVFKTYDVLAPPVPESEVPDDATRATILGVRAIKYFDLVRALHEARVRVVYGGHRIWDSLGNIIDKKDHPRVDVAN